MRIYQPNYMRGIMKKYNMLNFIQYVKSSERNKEITRRYVANNESYGVIAKDYGVTIGAIRQAVMQVMHKTAYYMKTNGFLARDIDILAGFECKSLDRERVERIQQGHKYMIQNMLKRETGYKL